MVRKRTIIGAAIGFAAAAAFIALQNKQPIPTEVGPDEPIEVDVDPDDGLDTGEVEDDEDDQTE